MSPIFCNSTWRKTALLSLSLVLATGAIGCGGEDSTASRVDSDMGATPDTEQPDATMLSLAVTSPADGAFLGSATADVEVSVEPTDLAEVTLIVMGEEIATGSAESGVVTFEAVDLSRWDATETPVVISARTEGANAEPVSVVVDTRRGAVEELKEVSERTPIFDWNSNGYPAYIHLDVPASGENAIDRGLGFFEEYSEVFRIENPREVLAPGRINTNDSGLKEVLFQQHSNGMPVANGALVVTFDESGERIVAFSGIYIRDLPELRDAGVTLEEADAIAIRNAREIGSRLFVTGHTRRMIYDEAIFDPGASSNPKLAWRVTVQGLGDEAGNSLYRQYWIDDRNGEILNVVEGVRDLQVKVLNANGKTASDGASSCMSKFATRISPACFQNIFGRADGCNSNADADGEAADARQRSIEMDGWLSSNFGWDTQSSGGTIKSFVNVTFDNGPNAQAMNGWCDKQLHFSDDWMVPDVFYHEMGHRLVRTSGTDFVYQNESGALDEHAADTFAALLEGENDGDGFDEVVGEDLPGGAIRNMDNPNAFGDPAIYTNRFTGSGDNGGVHINSGIPNKAMTLLAFGGQFQGFDIDAIGPDKVKTLLWKNLQTSRTNSSTNFVGWANSAVTVARNTWSGDEWCEVRNAFGAVGVIPGDSDCDGTPNNATNDNDGDGTNDGSDNCPQIYNPVQNDSDGDGTGDACDTDVDGDSVNNEDDNCPDVANPMQTDTNSNQVGDACEDLDGDTYAGHEDNCPMTENILQKDTDGDGVGDKCDADDDGDGVEDGADNCPLTSNPMQEDRNDNGVGDHCEDADGDGIVDAYDDCPDSFDRENRDQDNDGLIDACEDDDDDNDGIDDSDDNCQFTSNVEQADLDGDGVGYACDNCHDLKNPDQKDTDNDGKGDACDDDSDGDGIPDGADNCPLEKNPRQRDSDGDGQGDRCDDSPLPPEWAHEGELPPPESVLGNIPDSIDDLEDPFTGLDVPIDICKVAICKDMGYLVEGFEVSIEIGAAFPFRVGIIDGEGKVVRQVDPEELGPGENTELGTTVSFEPNAGAYYETDSAERGVFQGSTYRLRVFGDSDTPDSVDEAVELEQSGGLPE